MFEETDGLILMFHVDHISGEEVGWALETVEIPGLRNRHLISTMTKKGRPGYILLLDIDPKLESEAVESISKYIPVFGYHRLNTQHKYRKSESDITKVVVRSDKNSVEFKIRFRTLPSDQGSKRLFIESDDLVALHRLVKKELGVDISPLELKKQIEVQLLKHNNGCVEVKI